MSGILPLSDLDSLIIFFLGRGGENRSFNVLHDTNAAGQNISRYNGHSVPVVTCKTCHHMPHFSGVVNRSFDVRCFVIQMLLVRRLTDAMVILPII